MSIIAATPGGDAVDCKKIAQAVAEAARRDASDYDKLDPEKLRGVIEDLTFKLEVARRVLADKRGGDGDVAKPRFVHRDSVQVLRERQGRNPRDGDDMDGIAEEVALKHVDSLQLARKRLRTHTSPLVKAFKDNPPLAYGALAAGAALVIGVLIARSRR